MDTVTALELDHRCDAVFIGPLVQWSGSLAFHDHPAAVGLDALADAMVFEDLLARFGSLYPGADRHAVASFWSQHYFSRLTIAVTSFCLAADRPLPLDFRDLRVRFCPGRATPLCFHIRCDGPCRSREELIKALYEDHVTAIVSLIKRLSGLSAHLLWENVGVYGLWALGELARTQPSLAPVADALLMDSQWPRAACATLSPLKCAVRESRPVARRICCLRYRLPGVARCAGICPLNEATSCA